MVDISREISALEKQYRPTFRAKADTSNRIEYAAPSNLPALITPDNRERMISEIASGIGIDMRNYQNWQEGFFNPNPVMRGPGSKFQGYRSFEEMDADAKVYNVLSTRKEALLSRNYYVRSAIPGDQNEDFKAAFVAWNLDHIPNLVQKKREILSCLDYGFSVTEMILGYRDVVIAEKSKKKNGVITKIPGGNLNQALCIVDLKTRLTSAFGFDNAGNVSIVPVVAGTEPRFSAYGSKPLNDLELQRLLILTHDPRFGSRYGWPLKASMFWDYLMKKAGKIWRMIFIEKYGMPYLKGTYPMNTTETGDGSIQQFEDKLKGMQKNSYIMAPEGFVIDFVDALNKAGTMDVYQNLMDFCDGNISEVGLGHRQATAATTVGASASAEVKEGPLRQDKLRMDSQELDSVFNDQLIRRLIDWNFPQNGLYPYVITDVEPEGDKNKRIFQFATALNLGLELSKSQIRDEMKFNEPDDEEDTLEIDTGGGADMSPTNVGETNNSGNSDPTVGGNNDQNTQISDGIRKSAQKLTKKGGIQLTINL